MGKSAQTQRRETGRKTDKSVAQKNNLPATKDESAHGIKPLLMNDMSLAGNFFGDKQNTPLDVAELMIRTIKDDPDVNFISYVSEEIDFPGGPKRLESVPNTVLAMTYRYVTINIRIILMAINRRKLKPAASALAREEITAAIYPFASTNIDHYFLTMDRYFPDSGNNLHHLLSLYQEQGELPTYMAKIGNLNCTFKSYKEIIILGALQRRPFHNLVEALVKLDLVTEGEINAVFTRASPAQLDLYLLFYFVTGSCRDHSSNAFRDVIATPCGQEMRSNFDPFIEIEKIITLAETVDTSQSKRDDSPAPDSVTDPDVDDRDETLSNTSVASCKYNDTTIHGESSEYQTLEHAQALITNALEQSREATEAFEDHGKAAESAPIIDFNTCSIEAFMHHYPFASDMALFNIHRSYICAIVDVGLDGLTQWFRENEGTAIRFRKLEDTVMYHLINKFKGSQLRSRMAGIPDSNPETSGLDEMQMLHMIHDKLEVLGNLEAALKGYTINIENLVSVGKARPVQTQNVAFNPPVSVIPTASTSSYVPKDQPPPGRPSAMELLRRKQERLAKQQQD
jgi:hypothetical protein